MLKILQYEPMQLIISMKTKIKGVNIFVLKLYNLNLYLTLAQFQLNTLFK